MIRIVGVQRSEDATQEFVVLQNQGSMRANLRGHALVAESAVDEPYLSDALFVIPDEIDLMPGQYCLLRTCPGRPRWCHKQEGYSVYYSYMGRSRAVWVNASGCLSILAPQHTFALKPQESLKV
ncbi:MAG: hypothetical protein MUC92_01615 [Fimbriimonadaceae bacterium]|nr:hypothetical protein [Fimbriimonadaceae bacterium]